MTNFGITRSVTKHLLLQVLKMQRWRCWRATAKRYWMRNNTEAFLLTRSSCSVFGSDMMAISRKSPAACWELVLSLPSCQPPGRRALPPRREWPGSRSLSSFSLLGLSFRLCPPTHNQPPPTLLYRLCNG